MFSDVPPSHRRGSGRSEQHPMVAWVQEGEGGTALRVLIPHAVSLKVGSDKSRQKHYDPEGDKKNKTKDSSKEGSKGGKNQIVKKLYSVDPKQGRRDGRNRKQTARWWVLTEPCQ